MRGVTLKPCFGVMIMLTLVVGTRGLNTTGIIKRLLWNNVDIVIKNLKISLGCACYLTVFCFIFWEAVCECRVKLMPKVEEVYETLWILAGIAEMTQVKAALVTSTLRQKEIDFNASIPISARSGGFFEKGTFLERMSRILPVMDLVETTLINFAKPNETFSDGRSTTDDIQEIKLLGDADLEQHSLTGIMKEMEVKCPLNITYELYKNLTSEVTDGAHFMVHVEMNKDFAAANILGIRLMVVEMNKKTEKFHSLLRQLKNLSCPALDVETTQARTADEYYSDAISCTCVRAVIPVIALVIDGLQWTLHVQKEIEMYALTHTQQNSGISTLKEYTEGQDETIDREDQIENTLLGLDFLESFFKDVQIPKVPEGRSSERDPVKCPLQELQDYREAIQVKLEDAIHYREAVKSNTIMARQFLASPTNVVAQIEKKIVEYQTFSSALENRKC